MAGLNKVILIGRIGKDPEIYTYDDGTKKISFTLATTESYRDRSTNEWKDITDWHNIVGYRYLAEKSIAKGDLIYVEGKIKSRKYTDKDGVEKYFTEIVSEKINMLSKNQPGERTAQTSGQSYKGSSQNNEREDSPPPEMEDESGDLPF